MMKVMAPNVSQNFRPWQPSEGSVIWGKRFRASGVPQSNLPASTTTPPMVVPWPPIHLVAEWTIISAPWSIGRQKYPPAPNVLSTITGTPASCATLQIASKSGTLYLGFPIVSTYTAFVFSSIAFLKSSGLSPDTNFVVTPSRGINTLNWLYVPP